MLASVASLSLAACGGGSHSALPNAAPTTAAVADYTGPLADATFKIRIPGPTTSSKLRRPSYISSATKSFKFTINTATALTAGQITAYNARPWATVNVTLPPTASPTCPASGPDFICTITVKLPPGSDNLTLAAYDNTNATGNILSQQKQTFTVVVATANSFNVTMDANLGTMTVNGSGSCQNGPVGAAFGSVGTSPVTFTVAYTDPATKTVVTPGLPKLEIQDNTATYQSSSGTINGTGGTIAFTINQAAQTFTLTPSNSSTTNASINVKAVPADTNGTSDGLAFATTKSFSFSTGTAPPSHNFLAMVEQFTATTGQVDFFNVSLGGSGGPDSLSAFSPASLAQTTSTNDATQKDVDGPVSLLWDNTGDLLIGNGDTTGGNLACVPVGAISTGANSSTTVTTNVDDPVGLAYEPRNGTVAVGNNPSNAPKNLAEFNLTGNYTASTNNLKVVGDGSGLGTIQGGVVNVPTLAAGTFAIALSDGCEVDTNHQAGGPCTAKSKIAILSPTGVETDIANPTSPVTFAIDTPTGLAWDTANSQFVIPNNSGWHPTISFYTAAGSQVKVVYPPGGSAGTPSNFIPYTVATSPDGHVAVAWTTPLSGDQVQVYDNTAARSPVGGPIPYNGTTTSCGSTYTYGPGAIATSLTWLSNTKLLVSLQAFTGGSANATNGLYIYDISTLQVPAGFDDISCSAFAASPKQTGFHQITTNKPLATAFKP